MSEADWTVAVNSLNSASIARAVTAGKTPPAGGGSFTYGMRSLTNNIGALALYTNLTNFSPTALGGDITGALKKGGGGGNTNHSPFLFAAMQSTDVNDLGYLLGLSTTDPSYIELRKGAIVTGLTGDPVGTSGVLARSTSPVAIDTWVHLRLEMVVNTSGDVLLNVYQNDLDSNDVDAPVWTTIPGMSGVSGGAAATAFIDDALGANSGSLPYVAGRFGYGARFSDIARTAYFDHITLARQT